MIALNRSFTIPEYQTERTSSRLWQLGRTHSKSLQSATVVSVSDTPPSLSSEALKMLGRLEEFKSLRENWDSYHASSPSESAIRQAEKMVRRLDREGVPFFFTAPGPNGEIMLELKRMNRAAEIYFYADAPSDFVLFEGNRPVEEGFSEQNLQKIIQFIQ